MNFPSPEVFAARLNKHVLGKRPIPDLLSVHQEHYIPNKHDVFLKKTITKKITNLLHLQSSHLGFAFVPLNIFAPAPKCKFTLVLISEVTSSEVSFYFRVLFTTG